MFDKKTIVVASIPHTVSSTLTCISLSFSPFEITLDGYIQPESHKGWIGFHNLTVLLALLVLLLLSSYRRTTVASSLRNSVMTFPASLET